MSDDAMKPARSVAIVGTGAQIVGAVLGQALGEIAAANKARCASDVVESAPDIEGPHGRAWCVDLNAARERVKAQRGELPDATVAVWIVEAPWAHPAWHSYAISLVHLRPLAGVADALVVVKGATHELHVAALDPGARRQALISGEADLLPATLSPLNFAAQLISPKDAHAAERVEASVRQIVAGTLSPDTDFRAMWVGLYGGEMIKGGV